jgi:hypothetical protein
MGIYREKLERGKDLVDLLHEKSKDCGDLGELLELAGWRITQLEKLLDRKQRYVEEYQD